MTFISRIVSVLVLPHGDKIFSERATKISIVDEAGGEYIEVSQEGRPDLGKIHIAPEEWDTLSAAITKMIKSCEVA